MSGIVGSKLNHRGSGLVGSLGTDGQHLLSSGAGKTNVFETVAAPAAYDDELIKADITALALREATNEASAAFNLPGSFIETFTDDTNLGTQTTCDRQVGGYMESSVLTDSSVTINNSNYATYIADVVGHQANTGIYSGVSDDLDEITVFTGTDNTTYDGTNTGLGTKGAYLFGDNGDSDTSYWRINNNVGSVPSNYYFHYIGLKLAQPLAPRDYSLQWRNGSGSFWWNQLYGAINASGIAAHNTDLSIGALHLGPSESISNGTTYTASTAWSGYGASGFASLTTKVNYIWIGQFHYNGTNNFMYDNLTITGLMALPVINATGTLIQSANVVGSAKTKVGGTMFYKDGDGTASIGTDLKIYFTCNGNAGSPAWTEAASYNAITPVYSSGVKMVRLGETTCTSGTDIRYKAVWANQSGSSKETQLHGVGINY